MKKLTLLITLILAISLFISGCVLPLPDSGGTENTPPSSDQTDSPPSENEPSAPITLENIPAFDGETPFVTVNGGVPFFTEEELKTESYETYSELDSLGRCGITVACIGKDIMPTEERGSIGGVKPSGWHTVKYDVVDGKYLYNRCHLIGYQLTGENANKKNLITGTRYMNVEGMLPFENLVADYVKETENHVMYRVTPIFNGSDLVALGVLMEAFSVEDNGAGISFCVYVYNNQPGIIIDYSTGISRLDDGSSFPPPPDEGGSEDDDNIENGNTGTYIINKSTKKVHTEDCRYATGIKEENKEIYTGDLDDLLSDGYFSPCGTCKPEE